jgi:hypothetical protein
LLDLTLFGTVKREGRYYLPFSDLGRTGNFVYNVYRKMEKTLSPPNISAAFQAIEIICDTKSIPCRIVLHQEKLRESKGALNSGTLIIPSNLSRLYDILPNSDGSRNKNKCSSLTFSLFHPRGMEIQLDVRSAKSGGLTYSTGHPCI